MDNFYPKEQTQKLILHSLHCCQLNLVIWQRQLFWAHFMSCVRLPVEQSVT